MKLTATSLFGFLLLGFFSGGMFARISSAELSETQSKAPGQARFLVALVDDLEEETAMLIGAWLVVQSAQDLYWMPIYPLPLSEIGSEFALAHDVIQINFFPEPRWESLALVRESGAIWDAYLTVDLATLEALQVAAGFEAMGQLTPSWDQPQLALAEQVGLIQGWCSAQPGMNVLDLALATIEQGPGLATDLGHFEMIALWDTLFGSGSSPNCRHPWVE